jgi:hypothetical protein
MFVSRLPWSAALLTAALLAAASPAEAQTAVTVLGLTSLEGDDEFARNLSGALRNAASQVSGWSVSDRDVALSQMELTHDCASSDVACMTQIAATLSANRIIYGTIQRAPIGTRYEFQVTLFLFDAETGEIAGRSTLNVPSSDIDIDALREPARDMVRALSPSSAPGVIRVSSGPDLEVRIDGIVVGRTDAEGAFTSEELAAGVYAIQVAEQNPEEVTVAGGEVSIRVAAPAASEGGGGGGGSVLPWVGIGLLGVAAISAGVWIYAMTRLDALSGDPGYTQYRQEVGRTMSGMTTTNVCDSRFFRGGSDAVGAAAFGESACGEGSTMEVLQYVFLGLAVASAGAGAGLLAVGMGEGSGESGVADLRLRLTPSAGREHAYVGVALDF